MRISPLLRVRASLRPRAASQSSVLGNDQFVESRQGLLDGDTILSEISASQRRRKPLTLRDDERQSPERNRGIVFAYQSGGYTQKELGEYFGLHYDQVSKIIKNAKDKT